MIAKRQTLPLLRSFAPVWDERARVLVLGSMPGEESLRKQEYYGFPRNAFWRIFGEALGFDPGAPYAERLAALRAGGVALWDVIGRCRRTGSLDSDITEPRPNDIPALLRHCPGLRAIGCNGGAAHAALRRFFPALPLPVVRLPSTSPAAAVLSYTRKRDAWFKFLAILEPENA